MVDPLGEITSPVKSATEISIRENRAQRSASTDISRLINELPKQVYEVSVRILSERRLLSKDRSITLKSMKKFAFDYQSPLYDLQKDDNLNHFALNMQLKQQFFGQGSAMATVDLPTANKLLTEWTNLPHKLFVTEQTIKDYLKKAGEMAQQGALPQPKASATPVQLPQQKGVAL